MATAISLLGASKQYGGAQALATASLDVVPGTVHALVGENGAGKSTALKLLAGLEQPSGGSVAIDGMPVVLAGRAAAIRRGIGLVPQQLSLVPQLDLAENLIIGLPERIARRGRARARLRRAAADAGFSVPVDVPVHRLGLAQRQLGELAIALAQGAEVLLLDEPTSALGPYETTALFDRVRSLADHGAAVLLITHRVAEVRAVADRVTVLSHGRVALAAAVDEVDDASLVEAMVGELPTPEPRTSRPSGAAVLRLEGVDVPGAGRASLRGVELSVAEGEVVGVIGVAGNGQELLAEVAAGYRRPRGGRVRVGAVEVGGRPELAARAGLAFVPEQRTDALLPDRPVSHSAVLRRVRDAGFTTAGVLRWPRIRRFAAELAERHDVRPRDVRVRVGALSGGNQQKLLVGRELDGAPAVAVLHGPTQGLDLSAAAAIRREIRLAADAGTAVLLVSADIDEVRELADRIVVLSEGRIVDELPAAEFDAARVGAGMTGLTATSSATTGEPR